MSYTSTWRGDTVLNESDSYRRRPRGHDLGRCQPDEALERAVQVGWSAYPAGPPPRARTRLGPAARAPSRSSDLPITPRVSPVAHDTRRSTERLDRPSTSPCRAADATGSCTSRPARASRSTKTSALSGPEAPMPTRRARTTCSLPAASQRPVDQLPGDRVGMNVPRLNSMPKNSASSGIGTVVALVSGPRTVSRAAPVVGDDHLPVDRRHRDERGSGSLRVDHVSSTNGEINDRRRMRTARPPVAWSFGRSRSENSSAPSTSTGWCWSKPASTGRADQPTESLPISSTRSRTTAPPSAR